MALGAGVVRRLPHLPAGGCLPLLLLLLLLLCGQLGGGQKKKEVETFASFAVAPGWWCPVALRSSLESPCPRPLGAPRPARPPPRSAGPSPSPAPSGAPAGQEAPGSRCPCPAREVMAGGGGGVSRAAGAQGRSAGIAVPGVLSLPGPVPCAVVGLEIPDSERREARAAVLCRPGLGWATVCGGPRGPGRQTGRRAPGISKLNPVVLVPAERNAQS